MCIRDRVRFWYLHNRVGGFNRLGADLSYVVVIGVDGTINHVQELMKLMDIAVSRWRLVTESLLLSKPELFVYFFANYTFLNS